MEFVISERGKKHLCLDGYRYREKNQLKNGLIKWQCTFGNCRAVGYLDEQQEFTLKTEHAHLPSPSKIQAKKFANEVREKAANTGNEKLFGCLEQFGKKVVIDFEAAVRNAIKKMQPDTEIQFCFFHLGQAVWRNVQKLGFSRKYMDDDEFRLNVKKMICLAFVPIDDVIFAFEALRKEDPSEEFQSLTDYFEDTYIGACRGNRRVKPKFDIADWNVFNRVLSGEPRTNNALEAWNGSFNKFVSTKHPALPKLITRFKDEQKNAEINVERLMSGDIIRKQKPKYSIANDKLVQNAKNYNRDHIQKYLKLCTFNVHIS